MPKAAEAGPKDTVETPPEGDQVLMRPIRAKSQGALAHVPHKEFPC